MTMEGSGASRLSQLFAGNSDSESVTFTRATVKALPPEISVQVDGDSIDTPAEGIVLSEHLTEHTRTVSINGETDAVMTLRCDLKIGDSVIVAIADNGQLVYVLDKAVI